MDIQIVENIKETLSVVIRCRQIDDEVNRLKTHIYRCCNCTKKVKTDTAPSSNFFDGAPPSFYLQENRK